MKESLSVKDTKKLNQASVLSQSDDPKKQDRARARRVEIDFKLIPNDTYNIQLLPNALKDFWGNTHDTLNYRVSTKKIEDYGNIFIQLIYEESYEFILELLKDGKWN